jgi:hypothetical protein
LLRPAVPAFRPRALDAGLFETFKAHASVIPLAGLCLAGERRIGEPSPVQQFFATRSARRGIIAESMPGLSAMNPRRRLSE